LTLISQNLSAAETTGNLLTNSDFENGTAGWTLSDDDVKIDGPYSDAGNSKIIRFRGQDSTISQLVNLTAVEEGKEILGYTISYHGYGCGNDANGHCTQQNHDKIITNISFTDGSNTEVSSHTTSVIYEDGFTHYTFTKSINDTFLTGLVAINFQLTGEDSHTGNNWLAPITDNYEFAITYQDYVIQQAVEETMVGGLKLSNEVTLDLIKDIQIMPEIEMIEMPMDMQPMEINIDMPEMEMNTERPENNVADNMQLQEMPDIIDIPQTREIRIEMPSDLPEIAEVKPIEEIKEINVEGPSEPEPEIKVVEAEPEPEPETKTEPKTKTKIAANESGNLSNGEKNESNTKTEKSDSKKEKSSKEKSSSKKISAKKETVEEKTTVKSTKQSVDKTAKPSINVDPLGEISITNMVLLQIIPETIIIEETVSLTQEAIYEQDINAFTSSATYDSLISSSSSRWLRMVDVRPKHTFSGYGR
jgi:hypothetical protein